MFKPKRLAIVLTILMMAVGMMPSMAFAGGSGGAGGNNSGEVKIRVNEGGSSFSVKLGEILKLQQEVTGAEEGTYHIHWAETDGKKRIAFVKKDQVIADEMIASENANVKGLEAGTSEITVSVVAGAEHQEGCTGEILASKKLEITVKDDTAAGKYDYGPQGKVEGSQSVEMISPSAADNEITQVYPNADGQPLDYFLNSINKTFDASEPITFVFRMGKGMGGGYNEAEFLENGMAQIAVYKEGETEPVAGYLNGNLKFMGKDEISRAVTMQIEPETLEPGDYILVFGKDMCTAKGAATLGVDVKFTFTVTGKTSEAGNEEPDPELPGEEIDPGDMPENVNAQTASGNKDYAETSGNSETTDKGTPKTGDNADVFTLIAVMIIAAGAAVAAGRKKA